MSIKVVVRVEVGEETVDYAAERTWTQQGNGNPLFNAYLVEGGIVAAAQDVLAVVETMQGDVRLNGRDDLERTIPRKVYPR